MRRMRGKVGGCLAAALLICALAGGCGTYASSQELRAQAEQEKTGAALSGGGAGEAESDGGGAAASAESGAVSAQRLAASMPEFQEVSDTAYVVTSGGSVRIRSSCDTADSSNILASAPNGTKVRRTGLGGQWTRIDYNGSTAYIASEYLSEQAPSVSAASEESAMGSADREDEITLQSSWKYAEFSRISSGAARRYRSDASSRKNRTVCVNAGHGTRGGSSVKTLCHPDGSPKVTGGTTGAGATSAVAVSGGMTFADGTAESEVTLALAKVLKEKLLAAGYDVVMIREEEDVQLDNIARTVIANNTSDCHIALHWDSTASNKGAFYMSVPDVAAYRNMEPVKSHWQQHNALGESLVAGLEGAGVTIFSGGSMAMDLTQTSFSTIPSVDIELGDKASDHSAGTLDQLAQGLLAGVNQYFGES